MTPQSTRRCAIWVDTSTFLAAQELADLSGVDVDDFIEYVVKELHGNETREGALRARAQGSGHPAVIPLTDERRRQRQRRRD